MLLSRKDLRTLTCWLRFEFQPRGCLFCSLGWQAVCHACESVLQVPETDRCTFCGILVPLNRSLCGACLVEPPPWRYMFCGLPFAWPWNRVVSELKFQKQSHLGHYLGIRLADGFCKSAFTRPEALIPVPLSSIGMRVREYNQSALIASPIAHKLSIPVLENYVVRIRHDHPQSSLKKSTRARNIRGAFQVVQPIPYAHVAIVDDVITTMSTVREMAKVLRAVGVQSVSVLGALRA